MSKKFDVSKCDLFLVVDTDSYVLNSPVSCNCYEKAIESAFSMVINCYKSHLLSYGVVIYCIERQYNSYPKMNTFIAIGEIVEQLVVHGKLSKDDIVSENSEFVSKRKSYFNV